MEYDFWRVRSRDAGTLTVEGGGMTSLAGDGTGSGATAARFGNLAGIVRVEELEAGVIPHALAIVVRCVNGPPLSPAEGTGRACKDADPSDPDIDPDPAAPRMGQRFRLAMTETEIDALFKPGSTDWRKPVLKAFARYGAYVRDTAKSGWAIAMENPRTYRSFAGQPDKWLAFAEANEWEPDLDGRPHHIGSFRHRLVWTSLPLSVVDDCVNLGSC